MSETNSSPQPGNNPDIVIKQLVEDLLRITSSETRSSDASGGEEMLSLMLDEVSKGVDIATRYPKFYQRLLEEPRLRQAFLDGLDALENNETESIPWEDNPAILPEFLNQTESVSPLSRSGDSWAIHWQRTVIQLQTLFSPSELAFRFDPALSEDFWFILIQEEVPVDESTYKITLECKLSSMEKNGVLTPFISMIATIGEHRGPMPFPIRAILQWGDYREELQVHEAERVNFPDIPFSAFAEKDGRNINSDLELTLETISSS